jgi:acyl carrier protein
MHDELIAAIVDWNPLLAGTVERTTPLITSSRIDSLGLLQLVMWIEARIGAPIDVTAIDMSREWDDVDSIVRFVQQRTEGS